MKDNGFAIFNPKTLSEILEANKASLEGFCDCAHRHKNGDCRIHTCTVKDYIGSVLSGYLGTYDNNRGIGTLSRKTANRVKNDFNPSAIGEIAVGRHEGKMRIADGHGRSEGLIRRFQSGDMTVKELSSPISVRFIPDNKFLEVYKTVNTHEAHSAVESLRNKDYVFGQAFAELEKRSGDVFESFVDSKAFFVQMSYIIFHTVKRDYKSCVSYAQIFNSRSEVKKYRNCLTKDADFTMDDIPFEEICKGLSYCKEVYDVIRERQKERISDKKSLSKILCCKPLMAIIMMDVISGRHDFGKSAKRLANRILTNLNDLSHLTSCLTHSTHASTMEQESLVREHLCPKTV